MIERRIGAMMAMAGFSLSVFLGWAAHNSAPTILWRALIAMMVCYVVGWFVGYVAGRVIREHLKGYRDSHPIHMNPDQKIEPVVEMTEEPVEQAVEEAVEVPEGAEAATPAY